MNNKENLEGIVSKIKNQGINAGEQEKAKIIEAAKSQAEQIVSDALKQAEDIVGKAETRAAQIEKNTQSSMIQASRDMVEATRNAVLKYVKSVFAEECESLFTQNEYLEKLLEAVLQNISGKKSVNVPSESLKEMEAYIMKKVKSDDIELKPLAGREIKIVVQSSENEGLDFVLSPKAVEEGLFSLLNKDLVDRITKN